MLVAKNFIFGVKCEFVNEKEEEKCFILILATKAAVAVYIKKILLLYKVFHDKLT